MRNKNGQGLTEYIILVFLVAVISVGVVGNFGKIVRSKIKAAENHVQNELELGRH